MENKFPEPSWSETRECIEFERNEALERFRRHNFPARLEQRICLDADKDKKPIAKHNLTWHRVLAMLVVMGVFLGIYLTMKKELIQEKNIGVITFFQQSEKLLDLYNRRSDSLENTAVMNTQRFRTGQGQDVGFSYLEQTIDRFCLVNFKRFLEVKNG
jgi:hypothetical protein